MDSRLNAFLERAESVLARIEPLLPAPRPVIDWGTCLAARWQRDGRSGYLLPLEVSLDMTLMCTCNGNRRCSGRSGLGIADSPC